MLGWRGAWGSPDEGHLPCLRVAPEKGWPELEAAVGTCVLRKVVKYGSMDLCECPSSPLRRPLPSPVVSASLVCSKEPWAFPGGFSAFIMKNKTEESDRRGRGGEDYKI